MRATSFMLFPCALLLCAGGLLGQDRYPVRRLTTQPAQEGFPSWSPDGKLLVYALIAQEGAPGITGLWTVSAEGGEPRQILGVIAEHPDWPRATAASR